MHYIFHIYIGTCVYICFCVYISLHTVAVIILCVHPSNLICHYSGPKERLHFQVSWDHMIEFWTRMIRSRIVRISSTDLFISRLSS